MWTPFRYLIAGRPKWDVAWVDLGIVPNPRQWLEERLGPLAGFEAIPECRPMTSREAMAGGFLQKPAPDRWV
jgi:hypothetical protein